MKPLRGIIQQVQKFNFLPKLKNATTSGVGQMVIQIIHELYLLIKT